MSVNLVVGAVVEAVEAVGTVEKINIYIYIEFLQESAWPLQPLLQSLLKDLGPLHGPYSLYRKTHFYEIVLLNANSIRIIHGTLLGRRVGD